MRISDWSSDVCSSDLVARSRNPASGGVLGQGVSGRLFGSAVRSPSSIILPKLGTSERRVEFVVDAPFLAGDFEGFAEDSFGLRLVDIWHLLDLDFSGVCYGAIIPDEREAHPVIASILLCQRLHHFRGARRSEEHTSELQSLMR